MGFDAWSIPRGRCALIVERTESAVASELLAREILAFRDQIRELPVSPDVTPEMIRSHLQKQYAFTAWRPLDLLLPDVTRMMRQWSLHASHPRYFGLFNPPPRLAAIYADALAALYNPQLGAWAHSPIANEIERHVLASLASAAELDPSLKGHFTSAGAEANQTALLAAVASKYPEFVKRGARALPTDPAIYISTEAHHSFQKAARATGLGEHVLRIVPVDSHQRIDVAALSDRIARDVDAAVQPTMIVGTAGTTATGAIDDLAALANVASAHGAWFHVDAAWGGSALLSPMLRGLFRGVEHADSLTWDAHKWLCVPMGAGMFFCRKPDVLRHLFDVSPGYIPPEREGVEDLYRSTIQWSRRFTGLKVFMTLANLGMDGVRRAIERQTAMGEVLRTRLREQGWLVLNDTPLPLACFTHARIRAGKSSPADIVRAIESRGRAWISQVPVGEECALRACITSYDTDADDVDVLIQELELASLPARTTR
jgi:glutamate/tyrosine decarboxylase-like PLP-dependent enzyme